MYSNGCGRDQMMVGDGQKKGFRSRAAFGRMTKLNMKSVEDEIEEEMSSEEENF